MSISPTAEDYRASEKNQRVYEEPAARRPPGT
jgi:hypothetical protein